MSRTTEGKKAGLATDIFQTVRGGLGRHEVNRGSAPLLMGWGTIFRFPGLPGSGCIVPHDLQLERPLLAPATRAREDVLKTCTRYLKTTRVGNEKATP